MRLLLLIILLLPFRYTLAQNAKITVVPLKNANVKPWTDKEINNNTDDFQFAIVTDRTGDHREGIYPDAVRKLNLLQPEFVMSVGDMIEGYTEDISRLDLEWDQIDGFVNKLDMPFFYVPGNHDITNQVMEDYWKKRRGDTYYAFTYKDVFFLCLNSEDQKRGSSRGTISDEQYNWIEKTLSENMDVKHTLVFMHQPLWTLEDTKRWNDVELLLKDRKHHVFTGHYHRYTKYERNNGKYFVLATTGGRSGLRGPDFGEFDHVVWVTMKNGEPIVANLLLDGIWDENVLTEDIRTEIENIQDKSPFEFELVYLDEMSGKESQFNVDITNDDDYPMHVRLEPSASFDMTIFSDKEKIIVPPNSVAQLSLTMSLNAKSSNLRPAKFKMHIGFPDRTETEVEYPFEYLVKPIQKNNIAKVDKKIKVDGDLKEWKDLENIINSDEPKSLSSRFSLKQDEEMLYLAVKVDDDKVISYGSGKPYTQDYIGLSLNAELTEKSAMSVGENWFRTEMYFLISPEDGDKKSQTHREDKLPEGSQYACKTSESGYSLEWAIPLSYIKEKQGEDWKTVRFNLFIGDKDIDTEDPKMYYWKANWRSADNYVGSGMFFRNSK